MDLLLQEKILEQKNITEDKVVTVFSEIVKDSAKETLKYVENWSAPGGGE